MMASRVVSVRSYTVLRGERIKRVGPGGEAFERKVILDERNGMKQKKKLRRVTYTYKSASRQDNRERVPGNAESKHDRLNLKHFQGRTPNPHNLASSNETFLAIEDTSRRRAAGPLKFDPCKAFSGTKSSPISLRICPILSNGYKMIHEAI
ncbi:hypothetical protein GALMADRAFT_437754 [Galerina marginata CBS 339.88]|uniref:Uncharacterized protein n=1 Tax=Galerina marginata (strain CBS 339.88) TaxID=685588 RepID=A0A067T4I5_GALM3|nr:hypothetical protein GALMADRAFT_437754 [Galerina marginata CBS 339.88]